MSKQGSLRLRLGVGSSLLAIPLGAMAFPFEYSGIKASIDTTVSVGATVRMESPDAALIGISNGGSARSVNDDDGNYSFKRGDIVSAVAKASHDLDLRYGDYGLFSRFTYFFDQTADNADKLGDRLDTVGRPTRSRALGDYELGKAGKDRLGSEFQMLDLFLYGGVNVGDRTVKARIGKQVVNWGESTFIGNSINSINPIDVARIRAPGAELKEALLPTPILSLSTNLTDALSIEALWMAGWERTRIDPRSSFFSSNDTISDDSNKAVVGFGRRNDDNQVSDPANRPGNASAYLPRDPTREPGKTRDQFGLSGRWFANELAGGTEFGLYYLKYHSRTPFISGIRGGATSPYGGAGAGNTPVPTCSQTAATGCRGSYFAEFPSNIELYGLSFNLTAPFGIAVQGEYSYRPNQPVQLAGTEVLLTALGVPSTISPVPIAATTTGGSATYIQGWRDVKMHQTQVTLTKAFGPTLGAEQFVMLGEVGYTFLDQPDNLKFNGPGAGLPACEVFRNLPATTQAAVANGNCQSEGYGTKNSWGYRLVNRMDFEDVIGAVQMSPRLVLSHDVTGVGPTFNQGAKAVTLGLGFNYLQRWQADIGYTTFFGGRTYSGTDLGGAFAPGTVLAPGTVVPGDSTQPLDYATGANPNKDRDFLAVSVSYAF